MVRMISLCKILPNRNSSNLSSNDFCLVSKDVSSNVNEVKLVLFEKQKESHDITTKGKWIASNTYFTYFNFMDDYVLFSVDELQNDEW